MVSVINVSRIGSTKKARVSMSEWISTKDRLPKEMEPVIVAVTYADGHTESVAAHYLSYDCGWEAENSLENLRDKDIKWWRPYPEPPI